MRAATDEILATIDKVAQRLGPEHANMAAILAATRYTAHVVRYMTPGPNQPTREREFDGTYRMLLARNLTDPEL